MVRAGSGQPAWPITLAGTPATVTLFGTGFGHHRAGGDAGAMADLDIAEDFCAGADHDAVADFGVAVFPFLAGAAQGHVVQYRDIVADLRGLADHKPGGMIEENAAADLGRGMDVALEHRRRAALQIQREIAPALVPQPVHQPVRLDGMKTLVVEHRLDHPVGRRIAVDSRHEVGAERLAERRNILERLGIGLPDQFARHRRMVEPLGQPVDHGRLQRVVMQNGRIDEGRELGLAPYGLFRLAADARPYRIDSIEGRLGLLLRHRIVSPLNGENAAFYHIG